jgi:MFS family permease
MNSSTTRPVNPARSRWWPLVAICLGTFILLVDVTIVSVALPPMARDLHTQLDSLQWVVDAYALALAALLLVCGSLADRFGRRRLFQLGWPCSPPRPSRAPSRRTPAS